MHLLAHSTCGAGPYEPIKFWMQGVTVNQSGEIVFMKRSILQAAAMNVGRSKDDW
jgi:hypothetical protein